MKDPFEIILRPLQERVPVDEPMEQLRPIAVYVLKAAISLPPGFNSL